MIIVKFMGGLGNQMFQYAFGQELSYLYGEDIVYDMSSYKMDKQRNLTLKYFDIDPIKDWEDVIPKQERQKILRKESRYHILQKLMREIHQSDRVGENLFNYYASRGYYFNFDPYFYELPKVNSENKVAYGYFQGESYFQHCIEKLKNQYRICPQNEMTVEEKAFCQQIRLSNAICIHIRVGDYKLHKNRRFDVCTPSYFQKGIAYLSNKVENPTYFVFTNDPMTVEKMYNLKNVVYVRNLKDYQDMRLMMECKHFLISNSTFSWWASYLSTYKEKIIIVPSKWRNNQEFEPALMECQGVNYVKL